MLIKISIFHLFRQYMLVYLFKHADQEAKKGEQINV